MMIVYEMTQEIIMVTLSAWRKREESAIVSKKVESFGKFKKSLGVKVPYSPCEKEYSFLS